MDQTTLIINRVLPILLLIGLGYWTRRSQFLEESAIDALRRMVVNVALPSVLFITFLNIEMQTSYLALFATTFAVCVLLLGYGRLLKQRLNVQQGYFPFLMTGFEYGMLGVSLFGSAYGLANFGYMAVMGLGHELFIWFVFLALLLMRRDGLQNAGQLVGTFFRSPVIIAIILGVLLNLVGARDFLYERPLTGGVIATLEFLSNLIIPLILIIVGYGIRLDMQGVRETLPVVVARLALLIPLALILNRVLVRDLLGLEVGFEAALFTLLILPPPFIIPLYMPPGIEDEKRYVNNVLTVYTLFTIVIFAVYFVINPTL